MSTTQSIVRFNGEAPSTLIEPYIISSKAILIAALMASLRCMCYGPTFASCHDKRDKQNPKVKFIK